MSEMKIRLDPERSSCLICGRPVNMLKTDQKTCYSFDLGRFRLVSASCYCPEHKYFDGKSGQIIRYESDLAAMIVDRGYRVTFDLVVKIGRLRYEEHRQLHEIQSFLKCSPAKLHLPLSSVGMVAKRFLEFCQLLHQSRQPEIVKALSASGGYFLHFDGSTEQKSGKCSLVLIDSRSGLILYSKMIDSEKFDTIADALRKVKERYGHPLAIISDLRSGFVNACIEVFGAGVKHILCHYHFLRTFADDFKSEHQLIGSCITKKWQLQAGLKKQLKELPPLKHRHDWPKDLRTIEKIEAFWDDTQDVLATYRHCLEWILNYRRDSSGKSLPFDLPFLDLYDRLISGKNLIEKIFSDAPAKLRQKYYRHGFCRIVERTNGLGHFESGTRKALHMLYYKRKWFNKLRAVLFMEAQMAEDRSLAPLSKTYQLTKEEALKLPLRIKGFIAALNKEISKCKHPLKREFLENMKKQLEKYRGHLNVPILAVTIDGKEVLIMPPRTNNFLESLFRLIKALLRRCTGRAKLPREFGSVGALLPYFMTMRNHPIFKDIFADDRKLVDEFAKLFAKQWQPPENLVALFESPANVSKIQQNIALGA